MDVVITRMLKVTFGLALAMIMAPACNPLVKVEVECDKLCLSVPGPTLPGFSSLDVAGVLPPITANAIEWTSVVKLNQVLSQMPNGSSDDETTVIVTAVWLGSSEDLSFIDTVEVSLSHASGSDAGIPRTADRESVDAGAGPLPCEIVGSQLVLAHFQSLGAADSETRVSLALVAPDLNLFDCMKDDPTEFHVAMAFRPGHHPTKETPLVLSTCVRSESHMGFP